ncbi:conserved hypothetical protein [Candidatus Desulfarcum epimagneticum]|uniref:ATPase AAA-type core domain-containing protein n=1 Tax=uncultured Desulfobacteraceae bacterium TaxID=218296 RepID=A0A484HM27_9BACT|nr:conserved hypothetical protein [uncultured Desulfobacteraceae bacterium]
MARIEGFRARNFKVLKDVSMGKFWDRQEKKKLTPLTVVIGKNGSGKSALFDAFAFLADCLKAGVEEACDKRGRGGFNSIRSQGRDGPIQFEVYYREHGNARPITYELAIAPDSRGRPYVQKERLRQRRKGQRHGRPFSFLILNEGKGVVWKGETEGRLIDEDKERLDLPGLMDAIQKGGDGKESRETELVELEDARRLGIATLGVLKQHPRISAFRRFIEGWHLSYFSPNEARAIPLAGPQKHLNTRGDNLGNVVQFMEREHSRRFRSILERIAEKIPGVERIDTYKTPDGRLILRFNNRGFKEPFYARQMSDGTLKVFAYLLLLEDPSPPPFLCIEEPENGLYHKLLKSLADEFRSHATGRRDGSQVFITTHQPYFVDGMNPEEVWVLEKQPDGFSTIRRVGDEPIVTNMAAEGLPLGGLWHSDYLDPGQSNAF